MNKKATRLSSIALAFMMVFAVAVALFPVSSALAADPSAEVEIGTGAGVQASKYDSLNVVERKTQNVTIKVSKYYHPENRTFDQLVLQINNPSGVPMLASPVQMTLEGDVYKYVFTTNETMELGLYTLKLTRRFNNNGTLWDETDPLEIGGFWFYEVADAAFMHANSKATALDDKTLVNSPKDKNYVGPEAELNVLTVMDGSQPYNGTDSLSATTKYIGRTINPSTNKIIASADNKLPVPANVANTPLAASAVKVAVAKDVEHGKRLDFGGLIIEETDNGKSPKFCYYVPAVVNDKAPTPSTVTDKATAYADAKGPEVGEIKLTNDAFIAGEKKNEWTDYIIADGNTPDKVVLPIATSADDTHVQVASVTDADSDVSLPAAATYGATDTKFHVEFHNKYNKNEVYGGEAIAGTNESTLLASLPGDLPLYAPFSSTSKYVKLFADNSGGGASPDNRKTLTGKEWLIKVVATDKVGNKTEKEYGTVKIYENYYQVKNVRVEAENVLEMYVGQTLTKEDVAMRNVKVFTEYAKGQDASFPDNWYWSGLNDLNTISKIDFDQENFTIKAKAPGEARIYVEPLKNYKNEAWASGLPDAPTDYLRVKITESPSVKSIKLSNNKLELNQGATHKLSATTDPASMPITWESSDKAIATVDENGVVTAVAGGTATIYAKSGAQVDVCTVTVKGDLVVTGIKLSQTEATVNVGASISLLASTTPEGGAIEWSTSDATIAVVDNAGKVTGNKEGTVTITAKSGSASATCTVKVVDNPDGPANTWGTSSNGKKVYYNEHGHVTTGWKKIGGYWYLFDYTTGEMKTGWAKDGGAWYYLQADGKMKTGWLKDGTKWYYLQGSGAMKTGWLKDAGKWYYLHPSNGDMQTGWVKDGGIWYYLNGGNGDMKANEWLLESGVWYYLQGSGAMCANGTYQIDGRNSKFASSGRWLGYV